MADENGGTGAATSKDEKTEAELAHDAGRSSRLRKDTFSLKIPDKVCCSGTIIGGTTLSQNYLVLRFIFTAYSVMLCIWTFIRYATTGAALNYFQYFTHWNMYLNTLYFCFSFYLSFSIYKKYVLDSGDFEQASIDTLNLRVQWNLTWYFLNTGLGLAFFVITLYWVLIFDGEMSPTTWQTHGLLGVCLVADWLTSTWHLSYWGSLTSAITVSVWITFSLIFYAAGWRNEYDNGRYIYKTIDWGGSPTSALAYCVATIISVPSFHIMLVAIKNRLLRKWLERTTESQQNQLIELESQMQKNHNKMKGVTVDKQDEPDFDEEQDAADAVR